MIPTKLSKLLFALLVVLNNTIVFAEEWDLPTENNFVNSDYFNGVNNLFTAEPFDSLSSIINVSDAWDLQTSGVIRRLYSIHFLNTNTGFAAGERGTILKTTNGGISWIDQTSDTANLYSIYSVDTNIGFAFGHSGSMLSVAQYLGGVLVGLKGVGGRMLKTIDGGNTWIIQTLPDAVGLLRAVDFTDSNNGYIVGFYGTVLKTTDGGITWEIKHLADTPNGVGYYSNMLNSVSFINTNTGYAVGYAYGFCGYPYTCTSSNLGIILRTIDGGTNWELKYVTGYNEILSSVFFIDANTGYVVGNNGIILKTINGGNTWDKLTSGITNNLRSVFFTDNNTGFAFGAGGTILQTTDGGNTWGLQTSITSNDLTSSCFPNSNTGYAVGAAGTILKYSVSTGIPEQESNDEITVFPNPTTGSFKIIINEPLISNYEIEVFNNLGEIVLKSKKNMTEQLVQIDLSGSPVGIYFLKIKLDKKLYQSVIIRK